MKIYLGSKSKQKYDAVKESLDYLEIKDYELFGIGVSSDVSDNPINEETLQGARNRKNNVKLEGNGDIYIGIEAGYTKENDKYYLDTYCVVEKDNTEYVSTSPRLNITETIFNYVSNGNMLHELIEVLPGQHTGDGIIGFLTDGRILRKEIEEVAIISALSKAFGINKDVPMPNIEALISQDNLLKVNDLINKDAK